MLNFLSSLFGPMGTVIGMGDGRPDNSTSDMQALTKAYSEARAKRLAAQSGGLSSPPAVDLPPPSATPSSQLANPAGWGLIGFPSAPPPSASWVDSTKTPYNLGPGAPVPPTTAPPAVSQPQPATMASPQPVPMPMPRPDAAPQAQPDTSFFMRNALMQQDPINGGYLDPQGAASVRGPDLINKMMAYLHNKDMG